MGAAERLVAALDDECQKRIYYVVERDRATRPALDRDALTKAIIRATPPGKHGQLCPAWTQRRWRTPAACDCFISTDVPRLADAILAALDSLAPDMEPVDMSECLRHLDQPVHALIVASGLSRRGAEDAVTNLERAGWRLRRDASGRTVNLVIEGDGT